jgi:hypothetical protein
MLPFFYVAGIVSVLASDKMQRLGDLAAGTLVVHVRQAKLSLAPPQNVGAAPARITLRPDEQRAILSFAERSGELSDARATELAMLLQPLTGADSDTAAVALFRIANGLAGRR